MAADPTPIPSNLRRLRLASALTQGSLAERAGLSRVGYRKIEGGEVVPRAETLQRLADALGVQLVELLRPEPRLRNVRFRAGKKLQSRDQVLARVARWLKDYNDLEGVLEAEVPRKELQRLRTGKVPYRLGSISVRRRALGRARRAAEAAREALGLDGAAPIHDICGLLEDAIGVKVYASSTATDAFFGLSVAPGDGGPAVVVNTWDRITVERWIYSAAHELGHLVLHGEDYDVGQEGEERLEDNDEQEANVFASHFLMPEPAFEREWLETSGLPLVHRVLKLKRIFRVSYATVLYRLGERYPEKKGEVWKQFLGTYRAMTGRRLLKSDEPRPRLTSGDFRARLPRALAEGLPETSPRGEPERLSHADFAEDRLARLVRVAIQRDLISPSRGAEILDIPLVELRERARGWKDLPA